MLSIVIPTLNAEATLPATLDAILAPGVPDLDIVIVDGGSTDATRHVAETHQVHVIDSAPGRGRQLALGAIAAKSDWLMFLHADTRLPAGWNVELGRFIASELNQERAGYFRLRFDDASPGAKRVARLANWRARTFGLPYGDQGLVVHRTLLDEVGGYPEHLDIMEDVELARRIGPMRLVEITATVVTSAQKYRHSGWWARPAKNIICLGLYLLGAPLAWIKRLYT